MAAQQAAREAMKKAKLKEKKKQLSKQKKDKEQQRKVQCGCYVSVTIQKCIVCTARGKTREPFPL
jgi:PBP1b-binding outer membrane lipoprotein LpoB